MTKREQISELNSLLLMMLPHPSNTLGSEFADRVSGLIKVVSAIRDEAREEKDSIRIDFGKMREAYFNECVDKDSGRKLKVCLAPHDLFEWFKREFQESVVNNEKHNPPDIALECPFCKSTNTVVVEAVSDCVCDDCGKDFKA